MKTGSHAKLAISGSMLNARILRKMHIRYCSKLSHAVGSADLVIKALEA